MANSGTLGRGDEELGDQGEGGQQQEGEPGGQGGEGRGEPGAASSRRASRGGEG